MAEVGRSTSQGAVVKGDSKRSLSRPDLNSWQGLTQVLQAGRTADLSPEAYAEFRNLVLEYAQKRGDKQLEEQILKIVEGFSAPKQEPVSAPEVPPEEKKSEEKSSKTKEETPPPVEKQEEPVQSTEPEPVPVVPAPATEDTSKLESRPKVQRPVPSFLPRQFTEPQAQPEPTPKAQGEVVADVEPYDVGPETEAPIGDAKADAQTAPPDTKEPPKIKSLEEYRVRIAEIKRTVNAQVHNPVALVSENNALGKAYMSALLNAMKATSPGSPLDPHVAMRELEEAFEAVETFVAQKQARPEPTPPPVAEQTENVEPPQQEVVPEPIFPTTPEPTPEPEPAVPEPATEVSAEPPVTPPAPEPLPVPEPQPEPEPITASYSGEIEESEPTSGEPEEGEPDLATKLNDALERARSASRDVVLKESTKVKKKDEEQPKKSIFSLWHDSSAPASTEDTESQTSAQEEAPELSSVNSPEKSDTHTDAVPLAPIVPPAIRSDIPFDPTERLDAEIGKSVIRQSELVSPQVTESLNQLLHQWSIFASSGIFGIGPGGMDHPLYERLARLSMAEVIAGRWERANKEVIHTIKDYVDAWRHEQGIAYNPSETFEHYLRRVVLRILKRQRGENIV